MKKYIFIISLFVACTLQGVRWYEIDIIDGNMWANQAQYVESGDIRQFDMEKAYGHPGGPVIIGTIAIHKALGVSHHGSLMLFMALMNGLVVAIATTISFSLRPKSLWWIGVLGMLSLHWLFNESTPTSAVVAPLVALLCILTLYIYERAGHIKTSYLVFWSIVSGLAISTRADIGVVSSVAFIVPVFRVLGIKKGVYMLLGIIPVFVIFDPFMWFMPIQHMKDLVLKILYHYNTLPFHLSLNWIISLSFSSFVSAAFALILLSAKKKSPIPNFFLYTILAMSVGLYLIFLTAHFQAVRYFIPIVFIWEMFLPLFILDAVSDIKIDFLESPLSQKRLKMTIQIFILASLWAGPAFLLFGVLIPS